MDISFHNASPYAARASHDLIVQAEPVKNTSYFEEGDESVEKIATYIAGLISHGRGKI